MDGDRLRFFDGHMEAFPLYEAFEGRVMDEIADVRIKVQKSQLSFTIGIYLPVFPLRG